MDKYTILEEEAKKFLRETDTMQFSQVELLTMFCKYKEQLALCAVPNSLPDNEKHKLIENSYQANLQYLSGREGFDEAFKLGIMTGIDETLEKIQEKGKLS